jgi:N-acyl-D-aspartate/D-glutamate deacylase
MKKLVLIAVALFMLTSLIPWSSVRADATVSPQPDFDIAVNNGWVIDPISGFQGLANVGIKDGVIASITSPDRKLSGARVIDASGLIVSPGFINIHGHGTGNGVPAELYLRDGITTEISGNCGQVTLGISVKHPVPFSDESKNAETFSEITSVWRQEGLLTNVASYAGHNTYRSLVGVTNRRTPATPEQLEKMKEMLRRDMQDGALGVSFGPYYGPGATYEEMLALAKVAASYGGGSSAHLKEGFTVRGAVDSVNQGISISREAGIPFILSHVSQCPAYIPRSSGPILDAFYAARAEGLKIGMDAYPYDTTAVITTSPLFEYPIELLLGVVEARMTDFAVAYPVVIDGKTYMESEQKYESVDQFKYVLKKAQKGEITDPKVMVPFYNPPGKFEIWMNNRYLMIENDGYGWYNEETKEFVGDPINVGSFAKFLGQRVRDEGACDWRTAIARVSTDAACFLGLDKKGRVQVGCDADLTLFDPNKIKDNSTYKDVGRPSTGIPYVIVNGVLAVDKNEVTGVTAGKIIKRTWKVPGDYAHLGAAPTSDVSVLNPKAP